MSAADPDEPDPGRPPARREIEPSADAVVDQLRSLEAAWRFDVTPAATEIATVARAVDGLRRAIERAAEAPDPSDEDDLDDLRRTQALVAEAMATAERFLRMLADGGPGHPDA